jgi:hypothetical protein
VSSLDRQSYRTDKKFHSLTMGLYLFRGLLNMFEVMPMLMGSEMVLKPIEMDNNSILRGTGVFDFAPLLSLSPSFTSHHLYLRRQRQCYHHHHHHHHHHHRQRQLISIHIIIIIGGSGSKSNNNHTNNNNDKEEEEDRR